MVLHQLYLGIQGSHKKVHNYPWKTIILQQSSLNLSTKKLKMNSKLLWIGILDQNQYKIMVKIEIGSQGSIES